MRAVREASSDAVLLYLGAADTGRDCNRKRSEIATVFACRDRTVVLVESSNMNTKVIIKRSEWSRGNLIGNALLVDKPNERLLEQAGAMGKLLPTEGKMCCLGFACLALGVSKEQLLDKSTPEDLDCKLEGLTEERSSYHNNVEERSSYHNNVEYVNSDFSNEAVEINDDGDISDKEREAALTTLARSSKFDFKFID